MAANGRRLAIVLGTALTLVGAGGAACADAPARPQSMVLVRAALPQQPEPARPQPKAPKPPKQSRPARIDTTLDQIAREEATAEVIEEKLDAADDVLNAKSQRRAAISGAVEAAAAVTAAAQDALSDRTREAFIAESSRPGALATGPRNAMLGQPDSLRIGTARARLDLARAKQQAATAVLAAAQGEVDVQQAEITRLRDELSRLGSSIRHLRAARAAAALRAAQRARDAKEAVVARQHLRDADGTATGAARTAIGFAMAQRGKPYVWGAVGPNEYDCSGLVQTAYAHADITLPRTARPQYRASKPVPVTALLPGDLLFFATNRADWNTIHHVGIYLGNGLMVHAPTTGDVVRVAPVWWAEFFAAGRVVAPSASTDDATQGNR